jgi:hypothetical protein
LTISLLICIPFISSSSCIIALARNSKTMLTRGRESKLLLFSPCSSCVALQLQLCLVSSSPRKVGQLSFEYCPVSQEISSSVHHLLCFRRWTCFPTSTLSLCASPDLFWVLVTPLEVGLSSHPCFQLDPHSFTESLALCPIPILLGRFSVPSPPLQSMLDYSLLFMLFGFAGGGFSMPRSCARLCSHGVGRGVLYSA